MTFNPEKHHRRSIRLKGYDYSSEGLYFITICVQNKLELFGEIKNEEMILNEFGKIAHEEWAATPSIRENITLGEFQIMPNHLHGIIQINYSKGNPEDIGKFKSPSHAIGAIIRGFKGAATKRIKALIREKELNINSSTGESQFAPTENSQKQFAKKEHPTGKSQFAPTGNSQKQFAKKEHPTGESQFAPIENSQKQFAKKEHPTGESQFAPTENSQKQFAKKEHPTGESQLASMQFAPTEKINLLKSIWQRDYYEIIIRDSRAYNNISNYIINNPQKWTADKFNKSKKGNRESIYNRL